MKIDVSSRRFLSQGFARSEALDAFASKFVEAAEDARASVVEEAKAAAAAVAGEGHAAADLYSRFMDKATTKVGGGSQDCRA